MVASVGLVVGAVFGAAVTRRRERGKLPMPRWAMAVLISAPFACAALTFSLQGACPLNGRGGHCDFGGTDLLGGWITGVVFFFAIDLLVIARLLWFAPGRTEGRTVEDGSRLDRGPRSRDASRLRARGSALPSPSSPWRSRVPLSWRHGGRRSRMQRASRRTSWPPPPFPKNPWSDVLPSRIKIACSHTASIRNECSGWTGMSIAGSQMTSGWSIGPSRRGNGIRTGVKRSRLSRRESGPMGAVGRFRSRSSGAPDFPTAGPPLLRRRRGRRLGGHRRTWVHAVGHRRGLLHPIRSVVVRGTRREWQGIPRASPRDAWDRPRRGRQDRSRDSGRRSGPRIGTAGAGSPRFGSGPVVRYRCSTDAPHPSSAPSTSVRGLGRGDAGRGGRDARRIGT